MQPHAVDLAKHLPLWALAYVRAQICNCITFWYCVN